MFLRELNSILSLDFYALYVDDLVKVLKETGVGLYVILIFLAAILFADDLALLAPSRSALQKLVNVAYDYCTKFCLDFNLKKPQNHGLW